MGDLLPAAVWRRSAQRLPRANADKLNVAHAGVGSPAFTFALLLNSLLGVRPTMVPFSGALPAANALVGGQVDYK
jgi:tripartite-type tricarboxylate transporter receptor subunit TctC